MPVMMITPDGENEVVQNCLIKDMQAKGYTLAPLVADQNKPAPVEKPEPEPEAAEGTDSEGAEPPADWMD